MIPATTQLRARYSDLKIPVSIFAGADDKVVDPESNSLQLHQAIPQSTLLVAHGAGHIVHYAIPAQIADATERMSARSPAIPGDSGAAVGETSGTAGKVRAKPAQA
ncbi:pimeloyl-ACP methyl ester carboxylesterase [Paraburkholderia strydomiana]|nr:pimeloyl-ACP methyl ester carboxylesterase [Paraburkholderia strydomiana]